MRRQAQGGRRGPAGGPLEGGVERPERRDHALCGRLINK